MHKYPDNFIILIPSTKNRFLENNKVKFYFQIYFLALKILCTELVYLRLVNLG